MCREYLDGKFVIVAVVLCNMIPIVSLNYS